MSKYLKLICTTFILALFSSSAYAQNFKGKVCVYLDYMGDSAIWLGDDLAAPMYLHAGTAFSVIKDSVYLDTDFNLQAQTYFLHIKIDNDPNPALKGQKGWVELANTNLMGNLDLYRGVLSRATPVPDKRDKFGLQREDIFRNDGSPKSVYDKAGGSVIGSVHARAMVKLLSPKVALDSATGALFVNIAIDWDGEAYNDDVKKGWVRLNDTNYGNWFRRRRGD